MTITRKWLVDELKRVAEDGDACTVEDVVARLESGEPFDLDDTKEWLKENFTGDGCKCPACGKHVQLKDRRITPAMAKALIAIRNQGDDTGAVNIADVKEIRGGDYAKLRYWDLIEEVASGRWRITTLGRKFVADKERVPSTVWVYNKRVREVGEDTVNIREALGNPALYDQLVT